MKIVLGGFLLAVIGLVPAGAQEIRRAIPVEEEVPVARARPVEAPTPATAEPTVVVPGAIPEAAGESAGVSSTANDVALFLAGLRVAPESPLAMLQTSAAYGEHSYAMGQLWHRFNENHFIPMRLWSEITLAPLINPDLPLTYFFGGPDAINAMALFPQAPYYLLLGLEPAGEFPRPELLTPAELETSLAGLRRSVEVVLSYGHFITKDMREDLSTGSFTGVMPLMLAFVALSGGEVTGVSHIGVRRGGISTDYGSGKRQGPGELPGSVVKFLRAPGEPEQSILFLEANISDGPLKDNAAALDWVSRFGPANAYLKAASYLLHEANFSRVRGFLLKKSEAILQDDSGIPLRALREAGWQVRFFGTYSGTLDIFTRYFQADMQEAYKAEIPPELPFGTGYKWRKGESNLMLATRPPKPGPP